MLFFLIALRRKLGRPAERFTDLVSWMFVVNYTCSSSSRTDVLLEKVRKTYCLFHPQIYMVETLCN